MNLEGINITIKEEKIEISVILHLPIVMNKDIHLVTSMMIEMITNIMVSIKIKEERIIVMSNTIKMTIVLNNQDKTLVKKDMTVSLKDMIIDSRIDITSQATINQDKSINQDKILEMNIDLEKDNLLIEVIAR